MGRKERILRSLRPIAQPIAEILFNEALKNLANIGQFESQELRISRTQELRISGSEELRISGLVAKLRGINKFHQISIKFHIAIPLC